MYDNEWGNWRQCESNGYLLHNGDTILLQLHCMNYTAVDSSISGTLGLEVSPTTNEENLETFLDNRTAVTNGSTVDNTLLSCVAKHAGTSPGSTPTVQWIRNGEMISTQTGFSSSLMITSFTVANAGVYQCIFIDTDADAEILTTIPYRLDTGKFILTVVVNDII